MNEGKLKQRLVGAAVLIALILIVLPWVLGNGDETLITETNIPPQPSTDFSSKVIPLDEPPQIAEPLGPEQSQADVMQPSPPADATREATQQAGDTQDAPLPAAQADTERVAIAGTWVVQLASVASEQNALKLRDKLRTKGYTAFVETVEGDVGKVFRVRVGPELERAKAEAIRDTLQKEFNIKGIVSRYPS